MSEKALGCCAYQTIRRCAVGGAMQNTEVAKSLVQDLENARTTFGTLENVAEFLRNHRGFENISRVTVWRWLNAARQGKAQRRALIAVDLLLKKQQRVQVTVGEPETIWCLPATLIRQKHEDRAHGVRNGFELSTERVASGGAALSLLQKGQAHLAYMARELAEDLPPDTCSILCSITFGAISGLFLRKVASIEDLGGTMLAYEKDSAIPQKVEEYKHRQLVSLTAIPEDFTKTDHIVSDLKAQKIDGVLCWQPYMDRIRSAGAKKKLELFPMPDRLLGDLEIVLAVNLTVANPSAVREYLHDLLAVTQEVAELKHDQAAFQTKVKKLGFNVEEARGLQFIVRLEPKTVLTLWEREAYERTTNP